MWVRVGACGCVLVRVGACGCVWVRVGACGCVWVRVGACGCVWVRVGACARALVLRVHLGADDVARVEVLHSHYAQHLQTGVGRGNAESDAQADKERSQYAPMHILTYFE